MWTVYILDNGEWRETFTRDTFNEAVECVAQMWARSEGPVEYRLKYNPPS